MQQWFDSAKCAAEQARSLQEGRGSKSASRRSSSGVLTAHETHMREDDRLAAAEHRAARAEALVDSANRRAARAEANLVMMTIQLRLATIEHERAEIIHDMESMRIAQLTASPAPPSVAVPDDNGVEQRTSSKRSFWISRRGSGSSSIGSGSSSRDHGDAELNGGVDSPRASMEYSGNV